MNEPLKPGSVIGCMGGGQLGRMLALAAARLGLRTHIFEPAEEACAASVVERVTRASFDDSTALRDFAGRVDVITYEFENVPIPAVEVVADIAPVRPGRRALEVAQDRLTEKLFLNEIGIETAPFASVGGPGDLANAINRLGRPAILKNRRLGYDGKGQIRISASGASDVWRATNGQPSILEGFIKFEREISVIAARGANGEIIAYDPGENVHELGILRTTKVPATIDGDLAIEAIAMTGRILEALDYIGVLGVEFFVTSSNLIVNEIAPRVHNSGHWTQAACLIDQFEQHVRAIAGWPLGDGTRHSDAVMTNLIGDEVLSAPTAQNAAVQIYGKSEARTGRKMGHLTRTAPRTIYQS